MLKHRLIATLLVNQGKVVQTRHFKPTNVVGSPFTAVDFFNSWAVDEIAILEISRNSNSIERFVQIVEELSRRCFVPLLVGGKITSIDLVQRYTRAGADKVSINSQAFRDTDLIGRIASKYGSQSVVVSIDAGENPEMPSGYEVMIGCGAEPTGRDALDWAKQAVDEGVGEILLNSTHHDGDKRGYDLDLVRMFSKSLPVPVIAMGGVGKWDDLVDGITKGGADAVAAGNIFIRNIARRKPRNT
jgi:cyclase